MTAKSDSQLHPLTEGTYLFSSPQGNVLFGCPPEILKRILAAHLPMPDTVVVPRKTYHFHSSQASLEFPLYHFLFVQRGLERRRRFQVVATPEQCGGLEQLLRVTVMGPTAEEMIQAGTPEDLARELYQETHYLSLKNPDTHEQYAIREMINFFPVDNGERCELYPARGKLPEVLLERTGDASFRVLYGEESYELDLTVTDQQTPNYELHHKPAERVQDAFRVMVLGRSNGFDPNDPANGYLINANGRFLLWDCPAYLNLHLKKLQVEFREIDALILSHVHEDHIDVIESLRDPPVELYTTPEVHYSLLVKLSALFKCSLEEARRYYHWHPIDVRKPMEICGVHFEFFHAVHAIPALGCRARLRARGREGLLHISGDHLSNASLEAMREGEGISPRRYEQITGLVQGDEDLVLVDAGGGAIHGDYRDYLDYTVRLGFMHTGLIQEPLPENMELVKSGEMIEVVP